MSQSTIEAALRTLLMEEGRACLPGIGTLVVEAQPALVSLIEGRASPPSKYVSFNANLITDDGRLRQEAGTDQHTLASYLRHIETTLEQEKPFTLPGIGKLYRQDKDGVRFMPGANNLSKGSYGLPAVAVLPIIRKERLGTGAQSAAASAGRNRRGTSASFASPGSIAPRRPTPWPWYLAGVVGVLLAIFLVFRLAGTIGIFLEDERDPLAQPERRFQPDVLPTPAGDLTPEAPPQLADSAPPASTAASVPDPSESVAAAGQNEAIIYIGIYGRERNVRKQIGRLESAGYVPYTEREGRNTRVGVRLHYGTETELRRALTDLRGRFTPDAFIASVNGARRRRQ